MNEVEISYSQNREDILLASFFPDDMSGFYVDVGAHHPVFDSVTKYFYEKGWSGINLEPIKKYHSLLEADRKRDLNINAGISSKKGQLELREYVSEAGEGMSTFSKEMKEGYANSHHWATNNFNDYVVDVLRLDDVLSQHATNKEISFMKVDVEGYEYEVLESNDWDRFRPKVVCVEANHILKDWRIILKKANYLEVYDDGLNKYFVDEKKVKNPSFSYADDCLLRFPRVISWSDQKRITFLENRSQKLIDLVKLLEKTENEKTNSAEKAPSLKGTIRSILVSIDSYMLSTYNHYLSSPKIIEIGADSEFAKELSKKALEKYHINRFKIFVIKVYLVFRKVGMKIIKKFRGRTS